MTILPFGIEEAEQAVQIRAILKSQGQPIGAYDVLIAATALQHNLLMVTANQREFDRVPGLQTENWRHPQNITLGILGWIAIRPPNIR